MAAPEAPAVEPGLHPARLDFYVPGEQLAWIVTHPLDPVYIAGPMHDQLAHGYPAFEVAAARLRRLGLVVLSPRDGAPSLEQIKWAADAWDGDFRSSPLYQTMMKRDLFYVLQATALFMLPGWAKSRGASMEEAVGRIIGAKIWDGAWLLGPQLS